MTEYQERLMEALREMESAQEAAWKLVIRATNDLAFAIQRGEEIPVPDLMLELEKLMDAPALKTAWIYSRLEHATGSKRDNAGRIRRILGYGQYHGIGRVN